MHLSNHTLGLVSLQTQETARPWVMALWHSPFGQFLLYGGLSVHAFCGLAALARRRHYRMPVWEATQMLLGLSIPYLLLVHIVNTRGTRILPASTSITRTKSQTSGLIPGRGSAKSFLFFFGSCAAFGSSTVARCFASWPLRTTCRSAAKRPKATRIACLESVASGVRGLRCSVIATFRFTKTTLSEFGWILGKPGRRLRENVRSLFQGRAPARIATGAYRLRL